MTAGLKFVRTMGRYVRHYDWSRWKWSRLDKSKLVWPLRVMFHPAKGFDELKYEGRGSLAVANGLLVALFLVDCLRYSLYGFAFNLNRPQDFNLLMQFLSSSLVLMLWCVCNWASCTLLDGEGTFREIWIATFYAMAPRVVLGLPIILLSHALVLEEQIFLTILNTAVTLWSMILLLGGMMTMHQFSLKKTVLSSLLTLFAIVAVMFLGVLFASMFQQLLSFVRSVANELNARR